MARRILFTSQKGGVGKSTLARSAAVALASEGRRVLLADFDSAQGTCVRWMAQRRARSLKPTINAAPFTDPSKLKRAGRGFDDVIIDTAGRLDDLCIELAQKADAIFLPSSYSLDDIMPTLQMIEALRKSGAKTEHTAIVFCRTGGSHPQERQARSILAMNNINMLDAVFPQKDGFTTLYATGRSGRESTNPHLRGAAVALDDALIDFIKGAEKEVKAA